MGVSDLETPRAPPTLPPTRNCRPPELHCRRLTARPPEFCAQRVLLTLAVLLCTGVSALLPAAASRAQGAAAHSSRAALLSAAPTAAPALATLAAERRRSRAGVAMASVSKGQLVDAISEKAGVSKKTAAAVLGSALDVIVESVANGDRVSLVGFGTFDSKERAAREGRNPQTGEKMQLAGARAAPRRRLTRRCHHCARHLRRLRTAGPTATGNSAYRCIPATSYAQSTRHDRNPPLTTPDGNGANRVIHARVR